MKALTGSKPDKDSERKESDRQREQYELEEYGFLKPLGEARARKTETDEQSTAGGVEHVGVAVCEKVGENDDRGADALDRSESKHRNYQHCLCRGTGDKELDNENEDVKKHYRKIG